MELVSCLLPTYNRMPAGKRLVEESIESFLRQTYANKELLIVNDCPQQHIELSQDFPNVRVMNLPRRFNSIGDKLNFMVAMTSGELICCWDDDDVSLPWRIKYSVEKLGDRNYYKSRQYWFSNSGVIGYEGIRYGIAPAKCIFRRKAFLDIKGFPLAHSAADRHFEHEMRTLDPAKYAWEDISTQDCYYIYRWGTGSYHMSGYGVDATTPYDKVGQIEVIPGTYKLAPQWYENYVAVTRAIIETLPQEMRGHD